VVKPSVTVTPRDTPDLTDKNRSCPAGQGEASLARKKAKVIGKHLGQAANVSGIERVLVALVEHAGDRKNIEGAISPVADICNIGAAHAELLIAPIARKQHEAHVTHRTASDPSA